jgi:hypothetical protein
MYTSSSFSRSRLKAIDPSEPLISKASPFLRPRQKREASRVPSAPPENSTAASIASSTSTFVPSRSSMKVLVRADTVVTSCPSR